MLLPSKQNPIILQSFLFVFNLDIMNKQSVFSTKLDEVAILLNSKINYQSKLKKLKNALILQIKYCLSYFFKIRIFLAFIIIFLKNITIFKKQISI